MDRILIILKKENGPRASSAPALRLNTIIFKYVDWYMKRISGERLQEHWSSGFFNITCTLTIRFLKHCCKVAPIKSSKLLSRLRPSKWLTLYESVHS